MHTVSVVLILVLVAMASASPTKVKYDLNNAGPLFEQFIKDNNREYKDDADKEVHFQAFLKNLEKINEMNEKNPTATFGINKFADYTEDERQQMFGLRKHQ